MTEWFIRICLFFKLCTAPDVLSDANVNRSTPTVSPTLQQEVVTLLATGDVLLARSVNTQMIKRNDFTWPFSETADFLRAADITLINLETPLLEDCAPTDTGMIFCGDKRGVSGLVYAGIDVASIENNHADNYGIDGIEETKKILSENGIIPVNNEVALKEVKGMTFAFLAYNALGLLQADNIKSAIRTADSLADFVVVSFHWGEEYVSEPNEKQRELAYMAIDNGADLIIGNHPHWIQPMERYQDKVIIYSHGNFVFDQEWSEETKTGIISKHTIVDNQLVDTQLIPIKIRDFGQAYFPNALDSLE